MREQKQGQSPMPNGEGIQSKERETEACEIRNYESFEIEFK